MGNALVGIGDWLPGSDVMEASANIQKQAQGTHKIFKV